MGRPVQAPSGWIAAALAGVTFFAGPAAAQALFITPGGYVAAPVTSLRDMPFRTVVRQEHDFSCGSAALATLLRHHYGRPVDEAGVFRAMYAAGDQAKIQRLGFSLLDMKAYLAAEGLQADGYRLTVGELSALQGPAIALIKSQNYRHFVVIKGVRKGEVLVGDPARGLKAYRLAEFAAVWNGVVFAIRPSSAATGAFNLPREWQALDAGPFDALDDQTLAGLTRELPPLYQVTEVRPFALGISP